MNDNNPSNNNSAVEQHYNDYNAHTTDISTATTAEERQQENYNTQQQEQQVDQNNNNNNNNNDLNENDNLDTNNTQQPHAPAPVPPTNEEVPVNDQHLTLEEMTPSTTSNTITANRNNSQNEISSSSVFTSVGNTSTTTTSRNNSNTSTTGTNIEQNNSGSDGSRRSRWNKRWRRRRSSYYNERGDLRKMSVVLPGFACHTGPTNGDSNDKSSDPAIQAPYQSPDASPFSSAPPNAYLPETTRKQRMKKRCGHGLRKLWSIQSLILIILVLGVVLLGVSIWLLHFLLSKKGVRDVLNSTQTTQTGRIIDQIGSYLAQGPIILQTVTRELEWSDRFNFGISTNEKLKASLFVNQLRFSNPDQLFMGLETGEFFGIHEYSPDQFRLHNASDGNLVSRQINPDTLEVNNHIVANQSNFDPRTRPWYVYGVSDPAVVRIPGGESYVWNDPTISRTTPPELGITVSLRYRNSTTNKILGVVAVGFDLIKISTFLENIPDEPHTASMLINLKGELIAVSRAPVAFNVTDEIVQLLLATEHPDSVIRDTAKEIILRYGRLDELPANITFRYKDSEGTNRGVAVKSLRFTHNIDWYAIAIVQNSDVESSVYRANRISLGVSIATIVVAVIIALLIGYLITRPLHSIAAAMTQVANMNFSCSKRDPITLGLYEIDAIVKSINQMKQALRNFEKYVPATVVKALMLKNTGVQLGVRPRQLTVMFLDIMDFTTITERTPPEVLVAVLEEFFTSMSDKISQYSGVIDKYIGDSIMALFNAPNSVPNHEEMAVRCALDMHRTLISLNEEWTLRHPEYPHLSIRIGINTASCLVGNVGSINRVNYTALGDGVNIASFLESLNKRFKTDVIIGQETYEAVKSKFVCMWLSSVLVRGRNNEAMDVYTVLEEVGCATVEQIALSNIHEEIRVAIEQRNWELARELCGRAVSTDPTDLAAKELLERLEHVQDLENGVSLTICT